MSDPVVLSSGNTYERAAIEKHFKMNGKLDPMTREEITTEPVPNRYLKEAVEHFLKQNPWAFNFVEGADNLDM